jgi:hypothetical protein
MLFEQQRLYWMLSFGFVSGHDFSRAVKEERRIGLQPLRRHILHEMCRAYRLQNPVKAGLVHLLGREKSAGAKAQIFFAFQTARLKSCPDTKHQSGDSRKLAHSVDLDFSALSEM